MIMQPNPTSLSIPYATPVAQPPIYDMTLKDGEEIQIMELGVRDGYHQFILVDCLEQRRAMNSTNTTEGGYDACALRKKLNSEILNRFPDELREMMVPFENGDFLKLPSKAEIYYAGTERFECMKALRNRGAGLGKNSRWKWYWVSDVVSNDAFAAVCDDGWCLSFAKARQLGGVHLRFQIAAQK